MSTENQNPAEEQEFNAFDIFNTSIEQIESYQETESERKDYSKIFYEPDPQKDGKPYIAVIKFLPNIYGAKNPILKKFVYKLQNPDNPKFNFYFDSPTTVNDWEGCPVFKAWQSLNNSEDARDKAKAKTLKRTRTRCAVIQILKDPQHPELNGELRLFRFQFDGDIDKKIKAKLEPSKEEQELGEKPVDIFDLYNSEVFKLSVVLDTNGRDFSGSSFTDKITSGILLKDDKGEYVEVKPADKGNADIQKKIIEALRQEHVNINEHYAYKTPSEDRLKLANRAIAKLIGGDIKPETSEEKTNMDSPAANNEKPAETPAASNPEPATDKETGDLLDELFPGKK